MDERIMKGWKEGIKMIKMIKINRSYQIISDPIKSYSIISNHVKSYQIISKSLQYIKYIKYVKYIIYIKHNTIKTKQKI